MAPEDWNIEKLLGQATQEDERLKESRGDSALFVKHNNNKKFHHKNVRPKGKPKWDGNSSSSTQAPNSQGKAPQNPQTQNSQNNNGAQDQNRPQNPLRKKPWLAPDQCMFCEKTGHMQKDCLGFLKYLNRNGEDLVTFVDESLYISYEKSTWWIDSGATIHVANSLQGFHTRRTLQRGERTIKVANGVQADVEAIGDFTLALLNGFVLRLSDVLYVPSLHRNLISVSKLDDDGLACHFGNGRCKIFLNDKCVGLAI
jgi:hypothetical protein